jgi:hypothetical protein
MLKGYKSNKTSLTLFFFFPLSNFWKKKGMSLRKENPKTKKRKTPKRNAAVTKTKTPCFLSKEWKEAINEVCYTNEYRRPDHVEGSPKDRAIGGRNR